MAFFHLTLVAYACIAFGGISVEANFRSGSTEQKIYRSVTSQLACFRRMNATHTTGCSSGLTGNVGVLYKVDSEDDLKIVVETGSHSPYVAVMYSDKFTRKYMDPIKNSGRVSGVLLLRRDEDKTLEKFSMEKSCPNEGYGLYKKPTESHYCEKWNVEGTGLMHEDFDFPIFLINEEEEGKKVLDCYEEFNAPKNGVQRDWPLCATQLQSHMLAAVDSVTCIRRTNVESFPPSRICDPMGDMNVWGTLIPRPQTQPYRNRSVIIIAARMDASSMFDKLSPGADSAATGMTALMAITKHLQAFKDRMANSALDNVYFMLFNGEAYDYIGSSRIAYEMKLNNFPTQLTPNSSLPATLNFEHVKYFIELNQVALSGPDTTYYVHSVNATEVEELANVLRTAAAGSSISFADSDPLVGLPPSSFQTFRAHSSNIPGVVITNFNKGFRNKFYNSFRDDDDAIVYKYQNGSVIKSDSVQRRIADLSATVARAVINLGLNETVSIDPDYETVDEILHCFVNSSNCNLFREISDDEIAQRYPYPMYVGVYNSINHLTMYIKYLLTKFQGTVVPDMTNLNCTRMRNDTRKTVSFVSVGHNCYETTVNATYAISPAFDLRGKISQEEWNSGLYSTWTESVWQKFSVRIFLKPSGIHDVLTLTSGIALFLVSFVIIGWIAKKSDVIFPTRYQGYVPLSQ